MTPLLPDPDAPQIPVLPPWPKLKVFLIGLVWALGTALVPVAMFVYDSADRYKDDPLDWVMVWHLAVVAGGTGIAGYWRKYKAWLQAPPAPQPPLILSVVPKPAPPSTPPTGGAAA